MKIVIFNVGDLVIQHLPNPLKLTENTSRRGIITEVGKSTISIKWMRDGNKEVIADRGEHSLEMFKTTVRSLILGNSFQHYPAKG